MKASSNDSRTREPRAVLGKPIASAGVARPRRSHTLRASGETSMNDHDLDRFDPEEALQRALYRALAAILGTPETLDGVDVEPGIAEGDPALS